jgi:hypothetical protein
LLKAVHYVILLLNYDKEKWNEPKHRYTGHIKEF